MPRYLYDVTHSGTIDADDADAAKEVAVEIVRAGAWDMENVHIYPLDTEPEGETNGN